MVDSASGTDYVSVVGRKGGCSLVEQCVSKVCSRDRVVLNLYVHFFGPTFPSQTWEGGSFLTLENLVTETAGAKLFTFWKLRGGLFLVNPTDAHSEEPSGFLENFVLCHEDLCLRHDPPRRLLCSFFSIVGFDEDIKRECAEVVSWAFQESSFCFRRKKVSIVMIVATILLVR